MHFHDFCERDIGIRRLHTTEVTKIYNRTTIINNYTVNNTTIVNRGIPVERVAAVSDTGRTDESGLLRKIQRCEPARSFDFD